MLDQGWIQVFERLDKDRDRLLHQELTIQGKKKVFEKDEMVFFLGDIRVIITHKGPRFEIPDVVRNSQGLSGGEGIGELLD